ncbi:MAG: glutathione-disulfide reductase [Alphaproteobacteria bacterium]|nr:glutathione-disulfide reductase [Alphaproteobacteria bacterium]
MAKYDFDLFVIGAGSGGVAASRRAAAHGAKVAIAESSRVGGTCVIRGCVPKKLLVYGAEVREMLEDAKGYGWSIGPAAHDWPALIAAKDKEIARLNGVYLRMLANSGVRLYETRARIVDAHTVALEGQGQVSAERILVATGARPFRPAIPGADLGIVSDDAFDLEALPRRVLMVGGGYIAVEFAGIFHGLGAAVQLHYRGEQILRGFDRDLRDGLADELRKSGIALRLNSDLTRLERAGSAIRAHLVDGSAVETDLVMFATGRKPNTAGLGLEAAGVALGPEGAVAVDADSRTAQASIYAIGDVTNRLALTPVAINEGRAFADTVYGKTKRTLDYANIPSAVFSHPPIGTVGLSEERARARFPAIDIYKARFTPMKHTLSGRDTKTLMKLVVDARTDRVLGAHMLGADAPEIVQGVAIALVCGATKAQFDATVAIHPSAAEEFVTMREKWQPPKPAAAD